MVIEARNPRELLPAAFQESLLPRHANFFNRLQAICREPWIDDDDARLGLGEIVEDEVGLRAEPLFFSELRLICHREPRTIPAERAHELLGCRLAVIAVRIALVRE